MDSVGESEPRPLTVQELSDHIENAFVTAQPRVADLLDAAIRSHARPPVVDALNRLPQRRFTSLMDVLSELPELPISSDHGIGQANGPMMTARRKSGAA
ncbi:DUF2795 domain-containing protein [Amycolatopsis aidingensis]|uniref:DUF2795 domain-containing protein n=1 Tax=Amycolatopsis aidingensis TaxID=2842453 RepID=UPI001C0D75E4|nr:DUF2795 domain-containing protein [Amycolatopsis aidingensis]